MLKIKEIKDQLSVGFIFCLAIPLLMLIGGLVYLACYIGTSEFNTWAFVFPMILFVVSLILIIFKQFKVAKYLQFLLTLSALMFYIYAMYYYVSVVFVGIDADSFSASFIVCSLIYFGCYGLSIANLFIKNKKEAN